MRPAWAIAPSPEWSETDALAYDVRMATLEAMVVEHRITDAQVDTNTLHLMRIGGIYDDYRRADRASTLAAFAEARPNHCRRLRITARLWCVFDRLCEREQLVPRTADLQEFADRFRYVRDLMVRESMDSWLASQDLDAAGFGGLMVAWYRFEHMIGTANLGAFGVPPQAEPVWWLRDALWATGMYGSAEALLRAPTQERCSMPRHDEDAYARDFCDGIASVPVELRAMRDGIMVAL